MKTPLTIGQFIAFLIFIVPSSLFWVINTETRAGERNERIDYNKQEIDEVKTSLKEKAKSDADNFKVIIAKLHNIELGLKDKKDR